MKTFLLVVALFVASVSTTHAAVSIGLSPNNFTIYTGEQRTINATGASQFFIGSNVNPSVTSAVLSGSFITINALNAGTNSINICAYDTNNTVSCSPINVTVQKSSTSTGSPTQQTATMVFSQSQLTLNVGTTQTVTATGSGKGSYYVSAISDPSIVTASVVLNTNTITITASAIGGTNVTVCQLAGTCGNIYVYVPATAANVQAVQVVKKVNPGLSAFYIASNGANFLSPNSTLTIKFNTNENITSSVLRVGTQSLQVNGTSSGPYSATYNLTGYETYPLPITLDFWASDGTSGHTTFAITDTGMPVQTSSSPAPSPAASAGAKFTKALKDGSVGAEVSALQTLLKRLGYFSGPITGNYGPLTVSAVKKYQAAKGLEQLGSVGPGTRAALNKE